MTYLATEMLLYLLAAAIIGLTMGWLIWGAGQRRKLKTLRRDLTAATETEKEAHRQTRMALDKADTETREAVEAAKADAAQTIAELKETIEAERLAGQEARSALEKVQADLDEAVQQDRASDREAIDQALQAANAEKAAAQDAMAREAQSRAQIEELRLLIGAEKLAAESARAELEQTRSTMQATLDAERADHLQAKRALDDIHATLARTLGSAATPGAADDTPDAAAEDANHAPLPAFGDGQPSIGGRSAAFDAMTDMTAVGDALNNPDLDEADIEDREDLNLDLSSPIEMDSSPEEPARETDGTVEPLSAPMNDRVLAHPLQDAALDEGRPAVLLDQSPEDADDLQAVQGVTPAIERRLRDNGCYHYHQLAALAPEDIDWLAGKIDVPADQIADERWIEQARELAENTDADAGSVFPGSTDRRNAAS